MNYDLIKGKDSSTKIVFIHGTGCNRQFLKALAEEIKEFDTVLMDLACHGDNTDGELSFDSYVDSVADVISNLRSENADVKIVLVGHSLGGTVVLETLSKGHKNVALGIVVSSGASFPNTSEEFVEFMDKVHKGVLDMSSVATFIGHTDNKDVLNAIATFEKEDIILKDFMLDESVDVTASLSKITVPVLILFGTEDILALPKFSEELWKNIDEGVIVPMEGFMHMLPLANKVGVAKAINEFVSDFI